MFGAQKNLKKFYNDFVFVRIFSFVKEESKTNIYDETLYIAIRTK